ncbi:origin recognition complex subunit 3 N-terminus-domain-containing protein [Desarmillaria tabescens]|uniref:Origin recognition complex subunit 3 N-terminus-domain-containing protein n=1 Tax=Armillaria tabescens TaxID=1929756 RepID=A0AA39NNQ1_ARMTA|nr:origin recognition complex subunit 3 N-terminus-domain-containing protein [Desarmillaria tabescens]KAK0469029.1 origin recognition complex subunit 3 N-terminus-domain-containing protein [Desarmillaria tabescens]
MPPTPNFEDISQSVFLIPYSSPDDDSEEENETFLREARDTIDNDLEDGDLLRWEAYQSAWAKCLDKLQSIIRKLHEPVVEAIVEEVKSAYTDTLPGLPYPELPTITISNPAGGPSFFNELINQLDSSNDEVNPSTFVTHLHPVECSNIMAGMKTLITGFTDKPPDQAKTQFKRNSATSLASYDINLLDVWFTAVRNDREKHNTKVPSLVAVLHDFEQFNPSVMQDIFDICSLQIPQLPLIFIVALSSAQSPSYLHVTYPRSTLAVLRIRQFHVPFGLHILEEILRQTFFTTAFDPDVIIGPAALSFIVDYYSRYNPSLDSLLNMFQLAYLKHFMINPLSLLAKTTPAIDMLSTSFSFVDTLFGRLCTTKTSAAWHEQPLPTLIAAVDDAREVFHARVRKSRIAFEIMMVVHEFFARLGSKSIEWDSHHGTALLRIAIDLLKGRSTKHAETLSSLVRKLKFSEIRPFLDVLHAYYRDAPADIRDREEQHIDLFISGLPQEDDDQYSGKMRQLAIDIGDWLLNYLDELVQPLEELPLWELINPSIRASIISGLLRSHEFSDNVKNPEEINLWELPDTSILFRRYLDSGKMINVYDWFESFQPVLETQRRETLGPRKGSRRKRGKKVVGGNEDKWKLQVQARFIRALHELDYLGFIKHTGRKADHVIRTAFDVCDM